MLTNPATTTIQYGSTNDDIFNNEMTSSQLPSDGFVGMPPPPPPPPAPPVFNSNSINTNSLGKILLPHQEVNLIVNRANLTEIQARSVPTMLMNGTNIWTRCVLPNLRIKQTVFDQHYGESKPTMGNHYRRSSLTTSFIGGGGAGAGILGGINDDGPLSFVLLDATSKMLYDVPMRHLLQLVKKDHDDDASIDHVIRAIDETQMKSEWLDAVTALNKQFDKRPEDKARVLAHKGSTHGLVLIEQFFVKLVRVPAYEFKLVYLKFREEAPTQLERMSKHIDDLLESVQVILNNEQLPGILHLLCLLYNSITGKTIPGLHFDSLLTVLSTRTPKQNTTVAHVLCHLLEEQYPTLLNIFDNQILLKLKDLSSIKYIPIYIDIRLLYTRYKQLNTTLRELHQQLILLPDHIRTTLNDMQMTFTKLFDDENRIKKYEKDLSNYFCLWDLSIETCFSTLGQFIDKLRLAHMQNVEQNRRNELLLKQRSYENRMLQASTTSRLLRNSQNQFGSDTNIFRDHLNVPLTPTIGRPRIKIGHKTARERFSGSSRDISYNNDDDEEPIESIATTVHTENLLPNAIPRKRGRSPTTKSILTKRPFNTLPICTVMATTPQDQPSDEVFISPKFNPEHDDDNDTKMDCSTASTAEDISINDDDHSLPSNELTAATRVISVCEIQPSFYLTTPVRNLFDPSNDQSTPTDTIDYRNKNNNNNNDSISTSSLAHVPNFKYSTNDNDTKDNSHYLTTLTPLTASSPATDIQNNTELPSLPYPADDDSQQSSSSSSSSSLPAENLNDENRCLPIIPSLLSDCETLDEGFETQSNVSETAESTPRTCPFETNSKDSSDTKSLPTDEALADELTRRLTFSTTRRLSHDNDIRHNNNNHRRTSLSSGRLTSQLKTSVSAYSYPSFTLDGQQNQNNKALLTKRTPSAECIRSLSANNNPMSSIRLSRHIHRCAVSRRIWTEKRSDDSSSKVLTTSPPAVVPPSSTTQTTVEPDEVSSSSTVTTTTTIANHRMSSIKPKSKIRGAQSAQDSAIRSNTPLTRKVSSRLGHASSCQNVSATTMQPQKSSPTSKKRPPSNFLLNNNQILRTSFSRPNEKSIRAYNNLSTAANNESTSLHRPLPRTRRLFSSNGNLDTTSVSSPKPSRKPPSSWHHQKPPANKTATHTSTSLNVNRKTSSSTHDLRKTNAVHTSIFQRLTPSKRL